MNILVFNCGSSSLKYRLISMPGEIELAGGEAQRVGPPTAKPSRLVHRVNKQETIREVPMCNHAEALKVVMQTLTENPEHVPNVLGHRLVNGGPKISDKSIVNAEILAELDASAGLAPLHNPPAIATIKACREQFPELTQVVVSDTAFHRTIPEHAYTYPLPAEIREGMGIRKYGYHGISHQYVMTESAKMLGIPLDRFNAVSCHLGSGGASLCAIINGKSVDNTMGYSPLQGLIMSTRCGDLDTGLTLSLLAGADGNANAVEDRLNKNSGVLGLSGKSADIRDSLEMANHGVKTSDDAFVTMQVYMWRLRKYLGSYLAVVGQPHAIIFTDTIGETVPEVRHAVCADMDYFGLNMDYEKNRNLKKLPADVATADSQVRAIVILTNEELSIARSTYQAMVEHSAVVN